MMMRWLTLGVLVLANAAGCTIYWGDDCEDVGYVDSTGTVDPYTNSCQYTYYGGGCDSDGTYPIAEPSPVGAFCPGPCETLPEATCLATAECRGVYFEDPAPTKLFTNCWGIGPGSTTGACGTLDVWSCSLRDDCISIY